MSTQANVAVNAAREAVYDKVESQIHTFEAQLATLKAKAESAKADAELKAIASLVTAKRTLDQKVAELKKAGEAAFQQAKADVEARIAEFDKSIKAIEPKSRCRNTSRQRRRFTARAVAAGKASWRRWNRPSAPTRRRTRSSAHCW